jgi:hypothetical protein
LGNLAIHGFPALNYKITRAAKIQIQESSHGKYSDFNQGRTEEIETNGAQEGESGEAEEAARLRPRIEEEQSEEVGSRPIEAVAATSFSQLAMAGTVCWFTPPGQLLAARVEG